jgi:hypothetical protein
MNFRRYLNVCTMPRAAGEQLRPWTAGLKKSQLLVGGRSVELSATRASELVKGLRDSATPGLNAKGGTEAAEKMGINR